MALICGQLLTDRRIVLYPPVSMEPAYGMGGCQENYSHSFLWGRQDGKCRSGETARLGACQVETVLF